MNQITAISTTAEPDSCGALVNTAARLRPIIRSHQEEIERGRRIPPALVEQFRAAGLYRMLIPRELRGLQVDPLTCLRVVELIAEGDGSAGWNVANHAVGGLLSLAMPDEGIDEIFDRGPDVVFAGTLSPGGGRAIEVDGGYLVTGQWTFGSGCDEADWLAVGIQEFDGDQPKRNPNGGPVFRRAWFRASDCVIADETWDVVGMQGTGSHDWAVTDVFVPERRTVPQLGAPTANNWSRWSGTLYALPPQAIFSQHHSAVATGIARASIDGLIDLASGKVPRGRQDLLREQPQVQEAVGRAEALLGAARAYRTAVVADVWETVAAGETVTPDHLRAASLQRTTPLIARCRRRT